MEEIKVFKQGTRVRIYLGSVEAIISAIIIRHEIVTYELMYFAHGEYEFITLASKSFIALNGAELMSIGFLGT